MDKMLEPFREAMRYTIQQVLSELKPHFTYSDIAAVCGLSAAILSKVVCGNTTLNNSILVANALRIGYTVTIVNGDVTYSIEPIPEIVARCLAPDFTLKRRNKS